MIESPIDLQISSDFKIHELSSAHSRSKYPGERVSFYKCNPENTNEKSSLKTQGSNYWDNLSKSRLFPSCRSSLTVSEGVKPSFSSIFSDIKPSILSSNSQINRYEENYQERTGRFLMESPKVLNKQPQLSNKIKQERYEKTEKYRDLSDSRLITNSKQRIRKKRECHKPNCRKHRNLADFKPLSKTQIQTENENLERQVGPIKARREFGNNCKEQKLSRTALIKTECKSQTYSDRQRVYNRCLSNETTKANINLIFSYARTPQRPVLIEEKHTPIISLINKNSTEYLIIEQIVNAEGFDLISLTKTFTYALHHQLCFNRGSMQLSSNDGKLLLYLKTTDQNAQIIMSHHKGFGAVFPSNSLDSLIFTTTIAKSTVNFQPRNAILLCFLTKSKTIAVDNDSYKTSCLSSIIPIYNIEYR